MDAKLKSGIKNVFFANIINLIFNVITSFLLPKYLSIESYSIVKTFQLYISYIGLLHFGYVDGMYLKYGGKDISEIDHKKFQVDLSTMRLFQLTMTILWVIIGIFLKNFIIIAFALAILPENMNSYFRYLFQSVGEFKSYRGILNLTTIGTFIINIFLLFILKTDNSLFFCFFYVAIYIATWLTLEIKIRYKLDLQVSLFCFNKECFLQNIKLGIFLMLGTFSGIILTSIDRLFVKVTLGSIEFAQYSFAVTLDNFVNVAVTPVTLTLYNYFCRKGEQCNLKNIRNYIIMFSICIISSFFPAKFILEKYLSDYLSASIVLAFLFVSQFCFIIIKSIYVNLYKYKKMQKKYFLKLISVIIFGIIANYILFQIYPYKEAYVIGTFFSAIYWLVISSVDFKEIALDLKFIMIFAIEIIVFLVCAIFLNAINGLIIYFIISIAIIILNFRIEVKKIYGALKQIKKRGGN